MANNGADDNKPASGGREQRPYATLDLTARDITSKDDPAPDTAEAAAPEGPAAGEPTPQDRPRLEGPPDDEAPPPPPSTPGITGFVTHVTAGAVGAALALIIGYFIYAGGSEPAPPSPDYTGALRDQISRAEQKLAALEGEVRQAAAKAEQAGANNGGDEALKNDVTSLSDRIAAIESRPAASSTAEQAVQQSLDPVDGTPELRSNRTSPGSIRPRTNCAAGNSAAALALALYNLRRAAEAGKPFASELKSLAAISPVPLDLGPLERRGDQGLPSLEQLKASFDSAANAAIDAENQPSDDSFSAQLWASTKSFIRIRRKGEAEGDTTRAILARAEYQLDAGNLSATLAEAEKLKGAAADAMASWLAELKARIAAETALDQVETKLLTALGGDETAKRGG